MEVSVVIMAWVFEDGIDRATTFSNLHSRVARVARVARIAFSGSIAMTLYFALQEICDMYTYLHVREFNIIEHT